MDSLEIKETIKGISNAVIDERNYYKDYDNLLGGKEIKIKENTIYSYQNKPYYINHYRFVGEIDGLEYLFGLYTRDNIENISDVYYRCFIYSLSDGSGRGYRGIKFYN